MPTFDLVLLFLFLYFVFSGFWFGLIHTVGVLVGVVVGVLAASASYESVGNFLQFLFFREGVANAVSFIVIFLFVNQLVGFIFAKLNKAFKLLTIIPFLGPINRLAGAALGIVVGIFVLGTVLLVARAFPFTEGFAQAIDSSQVAKLLMGGAGILSGLLPDAVSRVVHG